MKKFISSLILMLLLFSFVAGPVLAYLGYRYIRKGQETLAWESTEGSIIRSQTHEVRSTSPGSVRSRTWQPDITYQYHADGETYQGEKIRVFIIHTGSRERARAWTRKYPAGAQVTVFFDPHHPYRSVLEAGVQPGAYLMTGLGVVLFGSVLGYHFVSRKARPSK